MSTDKMFQIKYTDSYTEIFVVCVYGVSNLEDLDDFLHNHLKSEFKYFGISVLI